MNPDKIYQVSQTQLSIARYYGGCQFNGEKYIYDYAEDILIREKSLTKKDLSALLKKQTSDLELMEWNETMKKGDSNV